ncbi:hypothetical protein [Paraburkholderia ribeironis]|uniref:hypothetical protein n=1 Tax=Paraburkholderia ribeironis TaxID=1247936 RepID=UPI001178B35E|nr:hypothetical protein [Paraburkholderia ribeironis]
MRSEKSLKAAAVKQRHQSALPLLFCAVTSIGMKRGKEERRKRGREEERKRGREEERKRGREKREERREEGARGAIGV